MKELAQFPRLCHADGALPVERFAHVAALAEDRQQQLGGGLAGMLDQELQVFGGCRVIRGHAMLAVVVLNKHGVRQNSVDEECLLLKVDRKSTRLNSSHR